MKLFSALMLFGMIGAPAMAHSNHHSHHKYHYHYQNLDNRERQTDITIVDNMILMCGNI